MGLNLETLIGILVILILLIVADGLRRVWRERQGRLRMRIRPGSDGEQDDPEEDHNPELIGTARVVRRNGDSSPPLVMETDEPPREQHEARQPRLFQDENETGAPIDDDDPLPSMFSARNGTPEPEPESAPAMGPEAPAGPEPEPAPEPRREPRPERASAARPQRPSGSRDMGMQAGEAGDSMLEVLVIHMLARSGERFNGQRLLELLLENGLRFGEMNIFHCHAREGDREVLQFSMANAVEPGTFDIECMEEEAFAGVTFFLRMPGPGRPLDALDQMLATTRRLAHALDGELRDEQRSVLTPQTAEHMRQRVQEFERRQRVPHVR